MSSMNSLRWLLLRQVLRFYKYLDLSFLPIVQLEQLDYQRSLNARSVAKDIKTFLGRNRLVFCDIGARGELPTELLGYEELLSLILFEPEAEAAAALLSKWGSRATVHQIPVGPKGRGVLIKTLNPGCSSLLNPQGDGRKILCLSQGDYAYSKVQITGRNFVECQPLSSAIEFEKQPIDILKIDAQGFDFDILTTLGLHRPFLIQVEVSTVPIYAGQRTLGAVLELLENLGYMAIRFPFLKPIIYASASRGVTCSVGDLTVVPDFSKCGQAIIMRDYAKWKSSLVLFGFSDLVNHQEWVLSLNGSKSS